VRIGVLTGGGDVPGVNPCIRTLVYRAIDESFEVLGIRRGWEGLLFINPDDQISIQQNTLVLDKINTRAIDRTGGTILHTSRTNPGNVSIEDVPEFLLSNFSTKNQNQTTDLTHHILKVIEKLHLDVLVVLGGDDTLMYADRLHRENIPVIAIPKTMDNDVHGTDYTIGFSTAITRSVELIHQLRTSSGSHERISVIELFGRKIGEVCLVTAYLASADRCIIPEIPFEPERLLSLLLADREINPSKYAMVLVSEGARFCDSSFLDNVNLNIDQVLPVGRLTAEFIQREGKVSTLYQHLAYLMRSGASDSLDLMVASNFANLAVELIRENKFGRMVSLKNGHYTHTPVTLLAENKKKLDVANFYDPKEYCPKFKSIMDMPLFLY
jgi:6-phosphofructokinase 1